MLLHPETLEPKICYDNGDTTYPKVTEELRELREAAKGLAYELIEYRDSLPSFVAWWESFRMLGEAS